MFTVTVQPGEKAIAKAIASLPPEGPACISLAPGIYREKVELCRPDTMVVGSGRDTVISWDDGAYTILAGGMKRGTFRTATFRTDAPRITLRGLTIENTAAPREKAGQAIALYADGDEFVCEDCVLRSFQDTLFTAPLPPKEIEKNGFIGPKQFAPRTPQRQIYRRCIISGDIDFIFGGAAAWFEDCRIIAVDGRAERKEPYAAYCTAASTPEGQKYGYVFSHCSFSGENIPERSVFLGRPWREYARTVLINCELDAHIHPAGFEDWGKPDFHKHGYYAEWNSRGPGADGERMADVRRLTDAEAEDYTLEKFIASMQ